MPSLFPDKKGNLEIVQDFIKIIHRENKNCDNFSSSSVQRIGINFKRKHVESRFLWKKAENKKSKKTYNFSIDGQSKTNGWKEKEMGEGVSYQ